MGKPIERAMKRTIKVKTKEVISALRENKQKHIQEYKKAKEAYKLEGLEQLEQIKKDLENGKTELHLNLVEPVDRTEMFDDFIRMFEMEVEDEIEMETEEFKLYVLDKGSQSDNARFSNSIYSSKFGL
jgi:hypothetical protein